MNKKTKNILPLMILLVQCAINRMEKSVFIDLAFLPEWFTCHRNDRHVETHVTLQNADDSLFIMACSYNLN